MIRVWLCCFREKKCIAESCMISLKILKSLRLRESGQIVELHNFLYCVIALVCVCVCVCYFSSVFRISKIWKFECISNNSMDIGGPAKKCNPSVLSFLSFLFTFAFAFLYIFSTILFFFKF